ncbi:DUF3883 domain-containing protein [Winogradskyella aurantiaca]|uniref:DUF3883 domain-containing protein n=1 Tax=Winogradskyella aurantiaca TaxID=2219558 RepID=UPI000E1D63E9|nr:DUF3883 domain-containing protein [Winogradskyella aurantiaca]
MTIDILNKENLLLNGNKSEFRHCLDNIFSRSNKRNISNIYYELTRTTNILDKDLDFLFHFLVEHNYVHEKDGNFIFQIQDDTKNLIKEFCNYYMNILISNKDINNEIFQKCEFIVKDNLILININSINIAYRPFLLVMQGLKLLAPHSNRKYVLITDIKIGHHLLQRPLKKISPQEFELIQQKNKQYGHEAEEFVFEFECKRLGHLKRVKWVALNVVNMGYDIESFDSINDDFTNRFIEVKSYDGSKPYFYWSKNEFQVAKLKGENYWIYLVNRSKLKTKDYEPEMYQNPYNNMLGDKNIDWIEEVDEYKITRFG